MKAIVVHPDRATAISEGEYTIEPKQWSTTYRGPLLIVSATDYGPNARGKTICVVRLAECRKMMDSDEEIEAAGRKPIKNDVAWVLDNFRQVNGAAVPAELGIYEIPDEMVEYRKGPIVRKGRESLADAREDEDDFLAL